MRRYHTSSGVEIFFFIALICIACTIGVYTLAAIPSVVGYAIFTMLGESWTFWTGAAMGGGTLILLGILIGGTVSIIKALKG